MYYVYVKYDLIGRKIIGVSPPPPLWFLTIKNNSIHFNVLKKLLLAIFLCCLGNIMRVKIFKGLLRPLFIYSDCNFSAKFWIQLHWFKMYRLLPYTHPCEFLQILVKCLWKAWAFHKLSRFLRAQFPGPGPCPRREEAIKCFVFLVKVTEVKS